MTVCEEKKYTAGLKRRVNACPFIRPLVPFVGQNKPGIIPFICYNKPSIVTGYQTAGFTLIELIITLSIAAILLALAAPSMSGFILNQRLSGQVNDLVADLNLARAEAVKRANNIGVCTGTSTGCNAGGNWKDGRIIFVDADNGGDWDAGEEILRVRESLDKNNTLNATNLGGDTIIFNNIGAAPTGRGTYSFCDSRGSSKRRNVVINLVGQVRSVESIGSCT